MSGREERRGRTASTTVRHLRIGRGPTPAVRCARYVSTAEGTVESHGSQQGPLTRRHAVRAAGLAALGGVTGAAMVSQASADEHQPGIVGSWLLTASGRRAAFAAMIFFLPAGVALYADAPQNVTQRTSDPNGPVEYQTIAGGQWLQTG